MNNVPDRRPCTFRRASIRLVLLPLTLEILGAALALPAHAVQANEADSLVLAELYRATDGDHWHDRAGWLQAPVADWAGITLNRDGRVDSIDLSYNRLHGFIPPALGQLEDLAKLDLFHNKLHGPMPRELSRLTSLRVLRLGRDLGRPHDPVYVDFTGEISPVLRELVNLRILTLTEYYGDDHILTAALNIEGLEELHLPGCGLTGNLPAGLNRLANLEELGLQHNGLTGPLPEELGRMTSLRYLNLRANNFRGAIPPEVFQLEDLQQLYLGGNDLTGPVPP